MVTKEVVETLCDICLGEGVERVGKRVYDVPADSNKLLSLDVCAYHNEDGVVLAHGEVAGDITWAGARAKRWSQPRKPLPEGTVLLSPGRVECRINGCGKVYDEGTAIHAHVRMAHPHE